MLQSEQFVLILHRSAVFETRRKEHPRRSTPVKTPHLTNLAEFVRMQRKIEVIVGEHSLRGRFTHDMQTKMKAIHNNGSKLLT